MPTAEPRVLVVVPTLGLRLPLLERTLASLRTQQGVAVDIVIVTPQPQPGLAQLALQHGARLVTAAGHISAAVNRGFAEAGPEHRLAAWIGDDDMLAPGWLQRAVAALAQRPLAVMCCSDCEYIDAQGRSLFVRRPPPGAPWLMQFVPGLIKSEACVFRLDVIRQAGGLDESLRYAMDLDLILRLRRFGPVLRCPGIGGRFRVHPGSLTISNRAASFNEAQRVQRRCAGAALRLLLPALQPGLLRLFMTVARRMETAAGG